MDVIADQYFELSLKEGTRSKRGTGTVIEFNEQTDLPSNFKEFLKNSQNKDRLNKFLAEKFMTEHMSTKILVFTHKNSILSNSGTIMTQDDLLNCNSEEADQRLVRHAINCAINQIATIAVFTYNTDVIILLLSVSHLVTEVSLSKSTVYCVFGMGEDARLYNITSLAQQLGESVCKGLPFFHAFTGCDTVSSFYNHSKLKFWDAWMKSESKQLLADTFTRYINQPLSVRECDIDILHSFVMTVYKPKMLPDTTVTEARIEEFLCSSNTNILRLLPISRPGLIEHIKRACIQAGWLWRESIENVSHQDPELWGWILLKKRYIPRWQSFTITNSIEDLCKTCTCSKLLCKNCKCAKLKVKCLPFCKCKGKCGNGCY